MQLDELAGEGEPEACALGPFAGGGLLELLEDRLEVPGGDAGAGVGDGDLDLSVVEAGGDVHPALARRELDRVGEEVEDDLADTTLVGRDADLRGLGGKRERDPASASAFGVHRDSAPQQVREGHLREVELHAAGLDLREVEDVVDQ